MLRSDYTIQYNIVVWSTHLHSALMYGFRKSNILKMHRVSKVIENEQAITKSDCAIIQI